MFHTYMDEGLLSTFKFLLTVPFPTGYIRFNNLKKKIASGLSGPLHHLWNRYDNIVHTNINVLSILKGSGYLVYIEAK